MWHPVSFLATQLKADAREVEQYALENEDRFGIVIDGGRALVSTWYADSLMAGFRTKVMAKEHEAGIVNPPW